MLYGHGRSSTAQNDLSETSVASIAQNGDGLPSWEVGAGRGLPVHTQRHAQEEQPTRQCQAHARSGKRGGSCSYTRAGAQPSCLAHASSRAPLSISIPSISFLFPSRLLWDL